MKLLSKKNIIWFLSWILVTILFSMLNQYLLTYHNNPSKSYGPLWGWGNSLAIMVVGPILGIQAAMLFLVFDYLTLKRKVTNRIIKLILRLILVISIVLLVTFIEKKYF